MRRRPEATGVDHPGAWPGRPHGAWPAYAPIPSGRGPSSPISLPRATSPPLRFTFFFVTYLRLFSLSSSRISRLWDVGRSSRGLGEEFCCWVLIGRASVGPGAREEDPNFFDVNNGFRAGFNGPLSAVLDFL